MNTAIVSVGLAIPRNPWAETQTFAIAICDFAVLENHIHVILRTRPDIVKALGATVLAIMPHSTQRALR